MTNSMSCVIVIIVFPFSESFFIRLFKIFIPFKSWPAVGSSIIMTSVSIAIIEAIVTNFLIE